MATNSNELRERYRNTLRAYVGRNTEEGELLDPIGFGRTALNEGSGLVDLLSIHASVLPEMIAGLPSMAVAGEIIARAQEFLTQAAGSFEMTHRGGCDAVERMHQLNGSLERQVADQAAALRDSERRFQDIVEISGDWTWETDREHRFTALLGAERLPFRTESFIGRTRWEGAGADPARDAVWARHKADLDAHEVFRHFRYEVRTPTGAPMSISASGRPVFDRDGNFRGYRGTATDETGTVEARRRAEAAEALLRDAIESISGGLLISDAEDRLVLFNRQIEVFYPDCAATLKPGAPYRDFLWERFQRGYYPPAIGHEEAWFADAIERHRAANNEVEIRLPDGRWLLVAERRMSNGGIAGVSLDISAIKETERRLRESEGQLRRAQRLARMGSDLRDLRTGEREWSDETYRIFGVSRETFAATLENVFKMIHPEDQPLVVAGRSKTAPGNCPEPIEYRIIRPDGEVRHVYREWELIHDDAGNPVQLIGTIQDITERRRTEEQLRQAQKMEAIGNLTGGMAHDFNNLLGVIVGNLDLARERITGDEELLEIVGEALEAAWRGADLTRRLLAFARRQPLRPARVDINELVSNTLRLLRRLLGEDIEVSLELEEDLWPVTVDPAQLEASLANLANNARDAMPGGGHLIITTANRHLDAEYAAMRADMTPGDYAMIEVSDTGSGISAETISHIFEPFFTTKEPGKGTGLGLSMVFGFLKQSAGHVSVYSEPGVGTTFRLYLPRATTEPSARAISEASVAVGGDEVILVVEDNLAVRHVVLRQLRELGYRVLECDRAAMALEILQREAIDLLFTDIVMPGGLHGIELARLARERWPSLKVVLTSGFPQARLNAEAPLSHDFKLLSKPYSNEELSAVLRAAFHG